MKLTKNKNSMTTLLISTSNPYILWTKTFLFFIFGTYVLWLQLKKYYQPRKSRRNVLVNLEGTKVPLYGAGSTLSESQNGVVVPLTLHLEIRSRGNVVGKLVRTKHKRQISCPVVIDSTKIKPIKFNKNSCSYDWLFFQWETRTFQFSPALVVVCSLLSRFVQNKCV